MITKSTFESHCNGASESDIITVNNSSTGESVLASKAAGGGGISATEMDELIEYLDGNTFETVHSSKSNLDWVTPGKSEPC